MILVVAFLAFFARHGRASAALIAGRDPRLSRGEK